MNLAQVIHQRWAAAEALDDLLPASRVFTGMNVNPAMPFAVIAKRNDRPLERFSDGSAIDTIELRIKVFDDDLEVPTILRSQTSSIARSQPAA